MDRDTWRRLLMPRNFSLQHALAFELSADYDKRLELGYRFREVVYLNVSQILRAFGSVWLTRGPAVPTESSFHRTGGRAPEVQGAIGDRHPLARNPAPQG